MTDFRALLRALAAHSVEFIVVGGAAATAHGSARLTVDLDVVYRRTSENLARIIRCFEDHHPYLRGAPAGLPFRWNAETLTRGLNFTLTTGLGAVDLLGEVTGGGGYDDLVSSTDTFHLFGVDCRCLSLDTREAGSRTTERPRSHRGAGGDSRGAASRLGWAAMT